MMRKSNGRVACGPSVGPREENDSYFAAGSSAGNLITPKFLFRTFEGSD